MEPFVASGTALLISGLLALFVLLFLIIKMRLHAMIAILMAALVIGLGVGMPLDMIVKTIQKGMGSTLQGIALLIGLGSMFGAVLETTGGIESLADKLLAAFGDNHAAWAMAICGMIVATPVFFDAGLIILIPLAIGLAAKTGRSVLRYALPLCLGLSVGHAYVPPTPGPILVADQLQVDLGLVIMLGILCGGIAMIVSGPIFGARMGDRIFVPLPERYQQEAKAKKDSNGRTLPGWGTVMFIICIPLILIVISTIVKLICKGNPDSALTAIQPFVSFIGEPFMALLISVLVAMYILGTRHGFSAADLEKVMSKALEPTGLILLVTAGGGVLRWMLQDSGMGVVLSQAIQSSHIPLIAIAFILGWFLRIAVGSATVAQITASGFVAAMLAAPGMPEYSQFQLALLCVAVCGGGIASSQLNDSGFWLVKSYLNIDVPTTLKTWTLGTTIVGITGPIIAMIIWQFV